MVGAFFGQAFKNAFRHAADHDHDLAVDVEAIIVVMAAIGGRNAMADKDQLAGDLGVQHAGVRRDENVRPVREGLLTEDHLVVAGVGADLLQRHFGEIAAIVAGRFKAEQAHLGGDIIGRDFVAVGARIASGEIIRGEEANVGFDIHGADIRRERRVGGVGVRVGCNCTGGQGQTGQRRNEILHGKPPPKRCWCWAGL